VHTKGSALARGAAQILRKTVHTIVVCCLQSSCNSSWVLKQCLQDLPSADINVICLLCMCVCFGALYSWTLTLWGDEGHMVGLWWPPLTAVSTIWRIEDQVDCATGKYALSWDGSPYNISPRAMHWRPVALPSHLFSENGQTVTQLHRKRPLFPLSINSLLGSCVRVSLLATGI
jgi:hypothetical protein